MENVILRLESPGICDTLALFAELCVDTVSCIILAETITLFAISFYNRRWEHSGF